MTLRLLALIGALVLASCDAPSGKPFTIDNVVNDIAFQAQHEEAHCAKGCTFVTVPDKWWLRVCNVADASDCGIVTLYHAPWKWEQEGSRVTVQWQRWTDGGLTFVDIWPTKP